MRKPDESLAICRSSPRLEVCTFRNAVFAARLFWILAMVLLLP
jgi:hypothetical protein